MIARDPSTSVSWAASRFYWAVLESRGARVRGPLPPGLLPDVAEEVPVPIDELHAVCVPMGGKVLVCAARRSDLAEVPTHVVRLSPAGAPAGVDVDETAIASLNLLLGAFEPGPLRLRRSRRHLLGLATVAMVAGLGITGLLRRATHWDGVALSARASADAMLAGVLPPGTPPESLPAEAARLQLASQATERIKPAPDAALALASLLRAWPSQADAEPQSIGVTETGITLSVLVENDASPFLKAFKPPAGWTMAEPRLNGAGRGGKDGSLIRVVIDLLPSPQAGRGQQ